MPNRKPAAALSGDFEAVRRMVDRCNGYQRALRNVTRGIRQLEHAAEMCARTNWSDPDQAVRYMREDTLGRGAFPADLAFCEVERDLASKRHDPFVALLAYKMVAPTIRCQRDAMLSAGLA